MLLMVCTIERAFCQLCSFKGQEYLQIYPYLEFAKTAGDHRDEFWVYDPQDNEKYIVLSA